MSKQTALSGIASVLFALLSAGSASSVDLLMARGTNPFTSSIAIIPLNYGPDFSNDPFPPYPPVYQSDGSNFTAANWRGTRLFGWKGCGTEQVNAITQAWNDFHKLASQKDLYEEIDWTSQAALDIWGHSTDPRKQLSDETKGEIKQIYESAEQMWDPWFYPPEVDRPGFGWMKLWIRVQCAPEGDDAKLCSPACKGAKVLSPGTLATEVIRQAYSEPYGTYSKVVFCNEFFNGDVGRKLDDAIGDVKDDTTLQDDLTNYDNQARVMFHEMTHLNYFMNAPDKSPLVDDAIYVLRGGKGTAGKYGAYGPLGVKTLANYAGKVDLAGYYTQRNADSYAWFAMAKWAEKQIGRYPQDPPAPDVPTRAPRRGDGKPFTDSIGITEDPSEDLSEATIDCVGVAEPPYTVVGVGSVESGNATCDNKNALSGVPYNIFSNEDSNVFGQFCSQIDPTQNLEWTVGASGFQKQAAAGKMKRTPPPDPDAYASFNFNLKWEPNETTQGCAQTMDSCVLAFKTLANSACGQQGGEQNTMTAAGEFDVPSCGTYSYSITGPDVPAPASTVAPSPSPTDQAPPAPSCNAAFDDHSDIHAFIQSDFASNICDKAKTEGQLIKAGNEDSNIHEKLFYQPGESAYLYDIYWEDGCTSNVSQRDAFNPTGSDQYNCTSLLLRDYTQCNNGGVGGKATVGCVTYSFSVGNRES